VLLARSHLLEADDARAPALVDIEQLPDASTNQVTLEKFLNLNDLTPGQYTVRLKITDKTKNQVLTPSADFTVT
jgi:hypothetical protein